MAAFSTSKRLQQYQFFSPALRKFPSSSFSSFRFSFSFPPTKHTFSQFRQVNARLTHLDTKLKLSKKTRNGRIIDKTDSGFTSVRPKDKRVDREFLENNVSSVVEENRNSRREIGSGYSSVNLKDNNFTKNVPKMGGVKSVSQKKTNKITKEGGSSQLKFVKNMPKTEGIERVGKKMDKISKKNDSQVKFAKNVLKMEGNERVGKKMDKISRKGESSQLKYAKNVPRTEEIERVSEKMDEIAKKGESSQLKFAKNVPKTEGMERVSNKMNKTSKKGESSRMGVEKRGIGAKKMKTDSPGYVLRLGLDMCSKRGDFMGGIRVYDLAKREGVEMGQYHYTVLLYLCSSAATGIIQPAKSGSGSGSRSLSLVDSSNEGFSDSDEIGKMGKTESESVPENCEERDKKDSNQSSNGSIDMGVQTLKGFVRLMYAEQSNVNKESYGIEVSEDVKTYALKRGFEIYEEMVLEKVPMNEATLTSLARMAMSMGNGNMAFDMVKQMKELGINPRLRSYGPALSVFCNNGDIEKAFVVEEHMMAHGVYPEESELEALMKVSVEASRSDKVYYLLHKLRTSVRKVLPSTANMIEKWFCSRTASKVGKRKWDQSLITKSIENGGGGWHGQGWLGKGKWNVVRTYVGADGFCKGCGEKLVTIDLDPTETEIFAESVAKIATDRDTNLSFEKFQKWLDYHGPFEAVVDAANVGLYSQRTFTPSKVNSIAEGIRQMLPSKKWPLIVLHNRRITGGKMNKGVNKILIEKWKNANALYATPTGSNDDWYWLYAAIKFKCLLVTNDEMRDHLFQLLGNDFFPKWKERHQVRFTFSDTGLEFRMPPPCSVVIQESEKGHWHIPIVSEEGSEGERMWLCITRPQIDKAKRDSTALDGGTRLSHGTKEPANSDSATETQLKLPGSKHSNQPSESERNPPQEIDKNRMNPMPSSPLVNQITIQPQTEAGEKLGGHVIDFQI